MKCEKYLNLIDDLVEGELGEQLTGQVNSHIFGCSECASFYESLKQEKQMYVRYLFDAEPSNDLWTKFQAKLELETGSVSQVDPKPAGVPFWRAFADGFWRLPTAFAGAGLLVLFGFGFAFLKFLPGERVMENDRASLSEVNAVQSLKIEPTETFENETKNSPAKVESAVRKTVSSKHYKNGHENESLKTKSLTDKNIQSHEAKAVKIKEKTISANEKQKDLPDFARLTKDEQAQIRQVKTLEKETVKQIEKIEMLLRSFRNARAVEGSEAFDVAYEKQQARKLLEKNAQLRRGAEDFGTLYTEEILSKAEPHLLDIANLENNPAPEKILSIKERVKNQNIIASLQIY